MLRWSNGSVVERSPRRINVVHNESIKNDENIDQNVNEQAQRNSMLEYDWTMQGTMQESIMQNQKPLETYSNKREDTYNKMAEREPICQIGQNPFMPNSSFADVVNNLQQNIPLVKEKREE